MFTVIRRECVYITYYFMVQLRQIAFYWILGMVIGSLVSVFAKDAIHNCFDGIKDKKWGIFGVIPASLLGIASPLCMYGTIPIAASFSRHGMRHHSAVAAVAGFRNEHGKCGGIYDHRACYEDYESGSAQNCPGDQEVYFVSGVYNGVFPDYGDGYEWMVSAA